MNQGEGRGIQMVDARVFLDVMEKKARLLAPAARATFEANESLEP